MSYTGIILVIPTSRFSQEALDRLPQDASVVDDILIQETEAEGQSPHDADDADDDPEPDTAAVPDLMADDTEMNAIREQVLPQNQLTLPSFRSTPISEFNRS